MRLQAKWFLEFWQLPSWELCNFSMGMSSWFYPITHGNEESVYSPTPPFSTDFDTGDGINGTTQQTFSVGLMPVSAGKHWSTKKFHWQFCRDHNSNTLRAFHFIATRTDWNYCTSYELVNDIYLIRFFFQSIDSSPLQWETVAVTETSGIQYSVSWRSWKIW